MKIYFQIFQKENLIEIITVIHNILRFNKFHIPGE